MTSLDRRQLLGGALAAALAPRLAAAAGWGDARTHHAPRARRMVFLFQSGGPSQLDLFDWKPLLRERHGEELPASVRRGQRLTGMSGNQSTLPLVGSPFDFARHGESGAWVSSLLPHTARIVDRLCIVRSVVTDSINHDPAITFFQTGTERSGRPSMGAWLDFGLGSANTDLPGFCVLITRGKGGQPLYQRLWGAGFLPVRHQGVALRPGSDAVLFLEDPPGVDRSLRERQLAALRELQGERGGAFAERLEQLDLAHRLQRSVPEVTDLSDEGEETFRLYGEDARTPGTFAANCLLARRLLERDVRFVQLYHQGWDQHGSLRGGITTQARETDQASAALVLDLERRGLLEDTLVVWGGEFGRTCYSQGKLTPDGFGRDHHPRCSTLWMAGGGVRAGHVHGETCDHGYNVVADPVHVHDLHATLLHLFGLDHERLTFLHQGRRHRLTDVHGRLVHGLLA